MANEDLRVTNHDQRRFQEVLTLACKMIEKADPGMVAIQTDHETDADGHVRACTVTVVPRREGGAGFRS